MNYIVPVILIIFAAVGIGLSVWNIVHLSRSTAEHAEIDAGPSRGEKIALIVANVVISLTLVALLGYIAYVIFSTRARVTIGEAVEDEKLNWDIYSNKEAIPSAPPMPYEQKPPPSPRPSAPPMPPPSLRMGAPPMRDVPRFNPAGLRPGNLIILPTEGMLRVLYDTEGNRIAVPNKNGDRNVLPDKAYKRALRSKRPPQGTYIPARDYYRPNLDPNSDIFWVRKEAAIDDEY